MNGIDRMMLNRAAMAGLRGAGLVEPNPMVGCVIATPEGRILAIGHHRNYGGPHAEIDALRRLAASGEQAKGAHVWVTLEPCGHHGKTGPCVDALIEARVARVMYARADPGQESGGGAARLRAAGIEAALSGASPLATHLSDPFVKRVQTGMPWVIAKWAQSIDGRLATRTGESKWISGVASRRSVHRLRARVDVVLTGIGTVLTDDPMLTAREVPVRRVGRRVVVDPELKTPTNAKLVATAREIPTVIATTAAAVSTRTSHVRALREAGVTIIEVEADDGSLCLTALLGELVLRFDATTVMVEGGAGLLGRLHALRLLDEMWIYIAPMLMGDEQALPVARGGHVLRLSEIPRYELLHRRRIGNDMLLRYVRPHSD